MKTYYQTTPNNASLRAPEQDHVGYAHPGDPTLQGFVIPHGRVETRQLDVGSDTRLLVMTLRCRDCDFEISVMEPQPTEGGRQ